MKDNNAYAKQTQQKKVKHRERREKNSYFKLDVLGIKVSIPTEIFMSKTALRNITLSIGAILILEHFLTYFPQERIKQLLNIVVDLITALK